MANLAQSDSRPAAGRRDNSLRIVGTATVANPISVRMNGVPVGATQRHRRYGGDGIEASAGAASGQISSTAHGAWSTTNRVW